MGFLHHFSDGDGRHCWAIGAFAVQWRTAGPRYPRRDCSWVPADATKDPLAHSVCMQWPRSTMPFAYVEATCSGSVGRDPCEAGLQAQDESRDRTPTDESLNSSNASPMGGCRAHRPRFRSPDGLETRCRPAAGTKGPGGAGAALSGVRLPRGGVGNGGTWRHGCYREHPG